MVFSFGIPFHESLGDPLLDAQLVLFRLLDLSEMFVGSRLVAGLDALYVVALGYEAYFEVSIDDFVEAMFYISRAQERIFFSGRSVLALFCLESPDV